eukprot:6623900-Lingulodinium_polyedra.AAC.1
MGAASRECPSYPGRGRRACCAIAGVGRWRRDPRVRRVPGNPGRKYDVLSVGRAGVELGT